MDIGALRHLITLEGPGTPVADGDGGYTEGWTTLATVWAEIKPATAKDLERLVAGTVQSSASHLVRIRYMAGITTQTQVVFGTRRFSVTGVVNPEERNVELLLTCVEVVA